MSTRAWGCAIIVMLTCLTGVTRAETQRSRHQRQNWFPPAAADATTAYSCIPASKATAVQVLPANALELREQAIAPLPPAVTTGLTSLGALGLFSCRRALKRFFV